MLRTSATLSGTGSAPALRTSERSCAAWRSRPCPIVIWPRVPMALLMTGGAPMTTLSSTIAM